MDHANTKKQIVTFWHGGALPGLHRECIRSWKNFNYEVTLYFYEPVLNIPKGVAVVDARTILCLSKAKNLRNWAAVADIIRLILILKPENVWIDTDLCLIKPIPAAEYLLLGYQWKHKLCNAIISLPGNVRIPKEILEHFYEGTLGPWAHMKPRLKYHFSKIFNTIYGFEHLPNSHWGSHALEYYIKRDKLQDYLLPQKAFYSPETYTGQLFEKNDFAHLIDDQEVFGFHFFNKNYDFDTPQKGSFYEWMIAKNASGSI